MLPLHSEVYQILCRSPPKQYIQRVLENIIKCDEFFCLFNLNVKKINSICISDKGSALKFPFVRKDCHLSNPPFSQRNSARISLAINCKNQNYFLLFNCFVLFCFLFFLNLKTFKWKSISNFTVL